MACCGRARTKFLSEIQKKATIEKSRDGKTSYTALKVINRIEELTFQRSKKIAQRKARIEARAARIKRRNERAKTDS